MSKSLFVIVSTSRLTWRSSRCQKLLTLEVKWPLLLVSIRCPADGGVGHEWGCLICLGDTKDLCPVDATFVSIRDLLRPRWLIDNER